MGKSENLRHIIEDNGVEYLIFIVFLSRLQWPRGVRHELSSSTRTLGAWVRIPLKALMFTFILCLYVGATASVV
jgi:hypothetical protein